MGGEADGYLLYVAVSEVDELLCGCSNERGAEDTVSCSVCVAVACKDHSEVIKSCGGCNISLCKDHAGDEKYVTCAECDEDFCESNCSWLGGNCPCGAFLCEMHYVEGIQICDSCNEPFCKSCRQDQWHCTYENCGATYCSPTCVANIEYCNGNQECESHGTDVPYYCMNCDLAVEEGSLFTCMHCGNHIGSDCYEECDGCGEGYCNKCITDHECDSEDSDSDQELPNSFLPIGPFVPAPPRINLPVLPVPTLPSFGQGGKELSTAMSNLFITPTKSNYNSNNNNGCPEHDCTGSSTSKFVTSPITKQKVCNACYQRHRRQKKKSQES